MDRSTRRGFLKLSSGLLISSGLAAKPTPSAGAGANDTLVIAMMGVRGRAGSLMKGFAQMPDVEIKTLIDIDSRLLPDAVAKVESWKGKRPGTTSDFRDVLDDRDIDAIVVGTPDHWHAIPTIKGCQAGKHVYVEKPDGHNIREGQTMVKAARRHDRVVQMGVQSRSGVHFAEAIDYLRGGAIGKALYARAWESSRQRSIGKPADLPAPPKGVDYDTWLGPAPERPFNPMRFHGNWRWFFDYGTGDLGNDGVHRIDMARRGLEAALAAQGGKPLGMPTVCSATGGKRYFDDMQEFPDTLFTTWDYPDRKASILYEMRVWTPYKLDDEAEGAAIFGDKGYVIIGNRRWRAFDGDGKLVTEGRGKSAEYDAAHKRNFVDCIASGKRPNCDIEIGHTTSVLCHLGNIAWRVGRTIRFDPETQTIQNDPQANALRTREYRSPWQLPEVG